MWQLMREHALVKTAERRPAALSAPQVRCIARAAPGAFLSLTPIWQAAAQARPAPANKLPKTVVRVRRLLVSGCALHMAQHADPLLNRHGSLAPRHHQSARALMMPHPPPPAATHCLGSLLTAATASEHDSSCASGLRSLLFLRRCLLRKGKRTRQASGCVGIWIGTCVHVSARPVTHRACAAGQRVSWRDEERAPPTCATTLQGACLPCVTRDGHREALHGPCAAGVMGA